MDSDVLGLQWTEHSQIFGNAIGKLRGQTAYADATLACDGKFYPVHKFILSTCSDYFSAIFEWTPCINPVIVINSVLSQDLESLLDFMYIGEANIKESNIENVMKAAEYLCIRGLSLVNEGVSCSKRKTRLPSQSMKKRKKNNSSLCNMKKPADQASFSASGKDSESSVQLESSSVAKSDGGQLISDSLNSVCSSPLVLGSQQTVTLDHSTKSDMRPEKCKGSILLNESPSHINEDKPFQLEPPEHGAMTSFSEDSDVPVLHVPEGVTLRSSSSNGQSHASCTSGEEILCHLTTHAASEVALDSTRIIAEFSSMGQKVDCNLDSDRNNKEIELCTEDGSVCIPEFLDGFVAIKAESDDKNNHMEASESAHSDDAADSLYDFSEDVGEASCSKTEQEKLCNSPQYLSAVSGRQFKSSVLDADESTKLFEEVEGGLKCLSCDYVNSKKEVMTRHVMKHSEFPYRCSKCDFKAKLYKELIGHRRIHATKSCPYPDCYFVTMRSDNLRRHIENHSKESAFKCDHCSFSTKTSNALKAHQQNHHR